MLKSLFNWAIHVGLFLILFWGQQKTPQSATWFANKVKDFILMGVLIIVSGLVNFIPNLYKRPVLIELKQKNLVTKKESTFYVRNETSLKQRTIVIEMNVTRQIGWNWLLNKYLDRNAVFIQFETNPKGLHLQVKDEALKPNEVLPMVDGSGFLLDITDFLRSINKHRRQADFVKKEYYFIKDPRENKDYYLNTDASFYVNPALLVNRTQKAPFWLSWALKWDPCEHKIEFYQNGRD